MATLEGAPREHWGRMKGAGRARREQGKVVVAVRDNDF